MNVCFKRRIRGSYSVEAILSLTFFLLSVLSLLSYISIIKVETAVQAALNNAVSEIVGYCYIADRIIGIPDGGNTLSDDISSTVTSFSELLRGNDDNENAVPSETIKKKLSDIKNTYSSVRKLSEDTQTMLSSDGNKDRNAVSVIVSALSDELIRTAGGRIAGNVLGSSLVKDYLPSSEKLEKMGLKNGIDGIDFGLSSVMSDGKTVKIVAVYEVGFMFGFIPSRTVCQEASGHAWLADDDCETAVAGSDIWTSEAKTRGKRFVNIIKDEHPGQAVREGAGFDLFSGADKSVTSVHSLNVFAATYSAFSPPANGEDVSASNYTLNSRKIESYISGLAKKLIENEKKSRGKDIRMENGAVSRLAQKNALNLLIILPNEAENAADAEMLRKTADNILKKYSVGVEYEYRYNALD